MTAFQPTIGIVIPTYNRRENLYRCLGVLSWQSWQDFVVVIADDGSTDDTRQFISELRQADFWRERLIFVTGGPRQGVRTGRARNIGAAALPPSVKLLTQLDTDMLLLPSALASFWQWHERFPQAVLLPQIDWLPEMTDAELQRILTTTAFPGLRAAVPNEIGQRINGTFVGLDLRLAHGLVFEVDPQPKPLRSEWYLPGASALPVDVYWSLGGYDEAMRGYGYQDLDFGTRLVHAGGQYVALKEVWCGHVWHPSGSEGHMITAQRNVDYLIRKYQRLNFPAELIGFYEQRCEWGPWWHFNRERGTTLARVGDDLYAVNRARTHCLQVPNMAWVRALGFTEMDIIPASTTLIEGCVNVGVAHDPIGDGLDYLPPPQGSLQ